jgi:hypothetical protein
MIPLTILLVKLLYLYPSLKSKVHRYFCFTGILWMWPGNPTTTNILPQYDFSSAEAFAKLHHLLGHTCKDAYPQLNAYYDHTMVSEILLRVHCTKGVHYSDSMWTKASPYVLRRRELRSTPTFKTALLFLNELTRERPDWVQAAIKVFFVYIL